MRGCKCLISLNPRILQASGIRLRNSSGSHQANARYRRVDSRTVNNHQIHVRSDWPCLPCGPWRGKAPCFQPLLTGTIILRLALQSGSHCSDGHTNFHVSHQELRRKFRTALEDSLASAMTLARGMNAHGIYLFEPRLLLPTIFDSGRSQRFANRNL